MLALSLNTTVGANDGIQLLGMGAPQGEVCICGSGFSGGQSRFSIAQARFCQSQKRFSVSKARFCTIPTRFCASQWGAEGAGRGSLFHRKGFLFRRKGSAPRRQGSARQRTLPDGRRTPTARGRTSPKTRVCAILPRFQPSTPFFRGAGGFRTHFPADGLPWKKQKQTTKR